MSRVVCHLCYIRGTCLLGSLFGPLTVYFRGYVRPLTELVKGGRKTGVKVARLNLLFFRETLKNCSNFISSIVRRREKRRE